MSADLAIVNLVEAVRAAAADHRVLHPCGGGSKSGLAGTPRGEDLDVTGVRGIVDYDPAELVVTVRAGTPLAELQTALGDHGQMLPFEPPAWPAATVGGTVASAIAGPRRAYAGGVRDALLGVHLLDGRGQVLRFGGRVMKNVAGFDLFRPQAGAWGRLGILLEVSFRLLPRPQTDATRVMPCDAGAAIVTMNRLAGLPLPLSAAVWCDGWLHLRLSGSAAGVAAALPVVGGESLETDIAERFWATCAGMPRSASLASVADAAGAPLWRLAVPPTTRSLGPEGEIAIDAGGGVRWLRSSAAPAEVRALATACGGHAMAWRGNPARPAMHPLDAVRRGLHRRLFEVFDPHGVFDHGRFDADADSDVETPANSNATTMR